VSGSRRRLVAPVSFGLGDLVVSLPVVQAAVRAGERSRTEVWLVARSTTQAALAERIAGLAGTVAGGDVTVGRTDELLDLRDHPLQRDFWWGSAEFDAAYGCLSINEIVARIGADLGIVGDFSAPAPLEARARPDAWSCSSPIPTARPSAGRRSDGSHSPPASVAAASTPRSSPAAMGATPWWIGAWRRSWRRPRVTRWTR
jgi:hypothetical protein